MEIQLWKLGPCSNPGAQTNHQREARVPSESPYLTLVVRARSGGWRAGWGRGSVGVLAPRVQPRGKQGSPAHPGGGLRSEDASRARSRARQERPDVPGRWRSRPGPRLLAASECDAPGPRPGAKGNVRAAGARPRRVREPSVAEHTAAQRRRSRGAARRRGRLCPRAASGDLD